MCDRHFALHLGRWLPWTAGTKFLPQEVQVGASVDRVQGAGLAGGVRWISHCRAHRCVFSLVYSYSLQPALSLADHCSVVLLTLCNLHFLMTRVFCGCQIRVACTPGEMGGTVSWGTWLANTTCTPRRTWWTDWPLTTFRWCKSRADSTTPPAFPVSVCLSSPLLLLVVSMHVYMRMRARDSMH